MKRVALHGSINLELRLPNQLKKYVHEKIYDNHLDELLRAGEQDPTNYEEALRHMKRQISAARKTILYPQQHERKDDDWHGLMAVYYRPVAAGEAHIPERDTHVLEECWELIISDAGNIAKALKADFDKFRQENRERKAPEKRVQVRLRAQRVLRALQYMLHALLYQLRASANETGGLVAGTPRLRDDLTPNSGQHAMAANFVNLERLIERLARSWGVTGALPRGEPEATYALNYGMWSHDFLTISEDELGWGRFSHRIAADLRYRRYSFELHQRWQEIGSSPILLAPLRFVWALLMEAFKWVAGFGLKPVRFAVTAVLSLLLFTSLYWLSDALQGPSVKPKSLAEDLFTAVVYLTSVGSNQTPGGVGHVLVAVESVLGYFLLSVLAAMLFAWFTDR
jgi:hypothetical protein